MNQRIRNIREDLEVVRENQPAPADDIWLSIDHNDPEALDRVYQFQKAYNDKLAAFDTPARGLGLSETVQQFTEDRIGADVNLSANMIRNDIRRLLTTFEIPEEGYHVSLYEHRDFDRTPENGRESRT